MTKTTTPTFATLADKTSKGSIYADSGSYRTEARKLDMLSLVADPYAKAAKPSLATVAETLGLEKAAAAKQCEAYGRKVVFYFNGTPEALQVASEALLEIGAKHSVQLYHASDYRNSASRLMVPVSFFRAHGWNA